MGTGTHTGSENANQSSDKLLQILECLARQRLPIRLQDLSTQVGMSQSTVLRYLNALQCSNYIYQEEATSRYALTWKICRLSENLNSHLGLRSITAPFITDLVNQLNLGVCLVIEQDFECVYLDCVDTAATFQHTLQRIGKRAPMHATGSGKVLLSQYPQAMLMEFLSSHALTKYTDFTIVAKDKLMEELEQVRQTKIGIDDQECELGLRCVSSPLYHYSGSAIAALSVFGDVSALTRDRIDRESVPKLQEVTTTISERLGYEQN